MKSVKNDMVLNMDLPYCTPIYRVFRVKYLKKMISEKENTLLHISEWQDPFEGFLLRQGAWDNESQSSVSLNDLFEDYYGQCWSFNRRETDATWRIYSPDEDRILVKSTIGKLWDGFFGGTYNYVIGKVKYWEENRIKDEFEGTPFRERLDTAAIGLAESLLIKRMEFNHEKEIRIIFNDFPDDAKLKFGDGKKMSYSVDPHNLIDKELIADPRMPDSRFQQLRQCFRKKRFNLKQSQLYQIPNLHIQY